MKTLEEIESIAKSAVAGARPGSPDLASFDPPTVLELCRRLRLAQEALTKIREDSDTVEWQFHVANKCLAQLDRPIGETTP